MIPDLFRRSLFLTALTAAGLIHASDCTDAGDCYSKGMNRCISVDDAGNKNIDIYADGVFAGAEEYLLKACELSHAEACTVLGDFYGIQPGNGAQIKDFAKSIPFYLKSCSLKNEKGCEKAVALYHNAGEYCEKAEDTTDTVYVRSEHCFTDATAFLKDECSRDRISACEALGYLYADIYEPEQKEFKSATVYYQKACDLNSSSSCYELARTYELINSSNTGGDFLRLYRKACEMKNSGACYRIAELYLEGQKVERNPVTAVTYLDKACGLNEPEACRTLSDIYKHGAKGIKKDAEMSQIYQKKAEEIENALFDECDEC